MEGTARHGGEHDGEGGGEVGAEEDKREGRYDDVAKLVHREENPGLERIRVVFVQCRVLNHLL